MSPQTISPSSPACVSPGNYSVEYYDLDDSSSSSIMLGTPKSLKSTTGVTDYSQTLQTSELNRLSWEKEIAGKVSVFDKPLDEFLDVFVPGRGASRQLHARKIKNAFLDVPLESNETEKYPDLVRRLCVWYAVVRKLKHPLQLKGLNTLVDAFAGECRPAFGDGSHCRVPFPFEAWGKEQHYTMPDIVMSLPGKCKSGWTSAWKGISTVFEVKRDQQEDPVHEGLAYIRTGSPQKRALVQVAKSARNLLHTHSLLYAYVIGIYNHKARIYRFDHAAGVVSKAIDLKEDPFPLFDFLWRFCNYQHPGLALRAPPADTTSGPRTRSMAKDEAGTGCFLGMDPTISTASKADAEKVDELLKTANPPQDPLTDEEKDTCRWISVVTGYNPDGSAGLTKRYIVYRLRFLNPRLFSRATRVWDAYEVREDGQWERRAIKDAWRQLARDREDVLYRRLRDGLQQRDDLEKLVEECKNFGLPREDAASDHADDSRSDAAPPSTAADDESESHELNDEGTPVLADELAACGPGFVSLYGLPDVEIGDDLGAREALKLFDRERGRATRSRQAINAPVPSSPSEANVDALAQGDGDRPPVYDVYHRTICAWLRDKAGTQEASFNERSHMRLVMRTVGRPLSTFKSTKEMVTAIRDAIIGACPPN